MRERSDLRAKLQSIRCVDCQSREDGIFCDLEGHSLEELDGARISRSVSKGEVLFTEGDRLDAFFCLRIGRVKLFKATPDGQEYILWIAEPGAVIGIDTLASNPHAAASAVMMEPGIVCLTDRRVVNDLVRRNPLTAARVIGALSARLNASDEQRLELTSLSVPQRTARVLAVLVQSHGTEDERSIRLHLPFTRQTLGAMIGAAPETIMRAFQQLRNEGVLEGRGRSIRILNLK